MLVDIPSVHSNHPEGIATINSKFSGKFAKKLIFVKKDVLFIDGQLITRTKRETLLRTEQFCFEWPNCYCCRNTCNDLKMKMGGARCLAWSTKWPMVNLKIFAVESKPRFYWRSRKDINFCPATKDRSDTSERTCWRIASSVKVNGDRQMVGISRERPALWPKRVVLKVMTNRRSTFGQATGCVVRSLQAVADQGLSHSKFLLNDGHRPQHSSNVVWRAGVAELTSPQQLHAFPTVCQVRSNVLKNRWEIRISVSFNKRCHVNGMIGPEREIATLERDLPLAKMSYAHPRCYRCDSGPLDKRMPVDWGTRAIVVCGFLDGIQIECLNRLWIKIDDAVTDNKLENFVESIFFCHRNAFGLSFRGKCISFGRTACGNRYWIVTEISSHTLKGLMGHENSTQCTNSQWNALMTGIVRSGCIDSRAHSWSSLKFCQYLRTQQNCNF